MKNKLKTITALTFLMSLHCVAEQQSSPTEMIKYQQRHIETSECIAFYKYGQASTKNDIRDHDITRKFKSLNRFLKKQLKLDVGEDEIEKLRVIGRNNLKRYLEDNDHIYELKHDGHATELLDLFRRYNPQCQSAIKYYQAKHIANK